MEFEKAREIVKEVQSDKEAKEKLKAKCRWEQMTATAVVMSWGDPREW